MILFLEKDNVIGGETQFLKEKPYWDLGDVIIT